MVISDGSDVCGSGGRTLGRGAGRGTAGVSAAGVRNGSSVGRGVITAGAGLCAGSAFSTRSDLGVAVGDVPFFFGPGDLSGDGVGLFFDFPFDFGVGDLAEAGVGLPFFAGVFVASGVVDVPGVGDSPASSGLVVALGVFVASGVGVAFAFAFGVGVGVGVFFAVDLDLRWAGFGFAVGEGDADGAGEVTARISSRAFFVFSSPVDCA